MERQHKKAYPTAQKWYSQSVLQTTCRVTILTFLAQMPFLIPQVASAEPKREQDLGGEFVKNLSCPDPHHLSSKVLDFSVGTAAIFQSPFSSASLKPLSLHFADSEGNKKSFSHWKGKKLLINFWAPWCTPCREEMPDLQNLQDKLNLNEVTILAIDVHRESSTGKKFYAETGLTRLAYYHDVERNLLQKLQIRGLPTTLLADENGCEIARASGPVSWHSRDVLEFLEKILFLPTSSTKQGSSQTIGNLNTAGENRKPESTR